jgi:gamma-glutamyltranspeptidase
VDVAVLPHVVDFGMNLQEAVDKPNFHSIHFQFVFPERSPEAWSSKAASARRSRELERVGIRLLLAATGPAAK